MRLYNSDPTIACPFYARQNDHLLVCRDENRKERSIMFSFTSVSDCVEQKDRFCRRDFRECPIYKELAKVYQ